MKQKKFKQIDAAVNKIIDDQNITKTEFCGWVYPLMRQKYPPVLIPTPLKIVYQRGKKLYIKDGFDPKDKNPLFGIQFPGGLVLSVQPHYRSWSSARDKAKSLRLSGRKGHLPTAEEFAEQTQNYNKQFSETLAIIKPNYDPNDYLLLNCILTSTLTGHPFSINDRYREITCYHTTWDENLCYYFTKGVTDDFFEKRQLLAVMF